MSADFTFGEASQKQLDGVHPQLQELCKLALEISHVDFGIVQGMRTAAQQAEAYRTKHSKIKSGGRHQFGCAIDFIVIDPHTKLRTYQRPELYAVVRAAFYEASKKLDIPIRTLEKMGDLGHIELPKFYMPDNWRTH